MSANNEVASLPKGMTRQTIGFFELPREMRDEFYGYLLDHSGYTTNRLIMKGPSIAEGRYLAVSRQFQIEYLDKINKRKETVILYLSQSATSHTITKPLSLPKAAGTITTLHITLYDDRLIDKQGRWICQAIKQLPKLRTVDITLVVGALGTGGTRNMRLLSIQRGLRQGNLFGWSKFKDLTMRVEEVEKGKGVFDEDAGRDMILLKEPGRYS